MGLDKNGQWWYDVEYLYLRTLMDFRTKAAAVSNNAGTFSYADSKTIAVCSRKATRAAVL